MRNVIVTGGSRGLGLGIASKLANESLSVIAIARKESSELTAVIPSNLYLSILPTSKESRTW
jgi:3-oxoacyl-[acyl-carrier protein] reductase